MCMVVCIGVCITGAYFSYLVLKILDGWPSFNLLTLPTNVHFLAPVLGQSYQIPLLTAFGNGFPSARTKGLNTFLYCADSVSLYEQH